MWAVAAEGGRVLGEAARWAATMSFLPCLEKQAWRLPLTKPSALTDNRAVTAADSCALAFPERKLTLGL